MLIWTVDLERIEPWLTALDNDSREQVIAALRIGLTQAQVAERIGVGQRQVSKIENGDLESTRIGTIRGYLEAVGGGLAVDFVIGDQRIQVV